VKEDLLTGANPLPDDRLDFLDLSDSGDVFFSSDDLTSDFERVDDESDKRDRELLLSSGGNNLTDSCGCCDTTSALAPPKLKALTSSSS
jgi:hypothetical protein